MSNLEKTSTAVPAQIERLPFSQLIRRIGPGIVLTGVVIGPGAITTASMLGADYGYSLLWLLIPIAFMGDHVYVDDLSYLHAHRDAVNRGDTSLLR